MKNVMRWNPKTGENQVFADDSAVPAGWVSHHPNSTPAAEKPAETPAAPSRATRAPRSLRTPRDEAPADMTRDEVVKALFDGGVQFDPDDDFPALYALLTEKVKAVLTEQGTKFDQAASTKTLLGLLSPAE